MEQRSDMMRPALMVHAIALSVYTVLFLVIPLPKNSASWISFVFTLAAGAISAMICRFAFAKGETMVSKVYGFPIFRVGYRYLLAQAFAGAVICVVGIVVPVPAWIAVVVGVLLMGAMGIGLVSMDVVRETVQKIEQEEERRTKAIKTFSMDIAAVVDACNDTIVRKELMRLQEALRFSDPVSNEETEPYEARIREAIQALHEKLHTAQSGALLTEIDHIGDMLADRNRRCKASKR